MVAKIQKARITNVHEPEDQILAHTEEPPSDNDLEEEEINENYQNLHEDNEDNNMDAVEEKEYDKGVEQENILDETLVQESIDEKHKDSQSTISNDQVNNSSSRYNTQGYKRDYGFRLANQMNNSS